MRNVDAREEYEERVGNVMFRTDGCNFVVDVIYQQLHSYPQSFLALRFFYDKNCVSVITYSSKSCIPSTWAYNAPIFRIEDNEQ